MQRYAQPLRYLPAQLLCFICSTVITCTASHICFSVSVSAPDCCSASAGSFAYLGCYIDNGGSRDLSGPAHTVASTPLTAAQECATHCSEYTYFGLQWTNECFCGNTFGGYGAAANAVASCGQVVNGVASLCANGAQNCGSVNAVYRVAGQGALLQYKNTVLSIWFHAFE